MKFLRNILSCIFGVLCLTACQNEEPFIIKYPQIPDPTIEVVSVVNEDYYYNYNGTKVAIEIIATPVENEYCYMYVNMGWDRTGLWNLQEVTSIIDMTTNSNIPVDFVSNGVVGDSYTTHYTIKTPNGTFLQPGHTYKIDASAEINAYLRLKDNVCDELEDKYDIYLRLKPVSRTYAEELTFTVPAENN